MPSMENDLVRLCPEGVFRASRCEASNLGLVFQEQYLLMFDKTIRVAYPRFYNASQSIIFLCEIKPD
jgi:hypothetical protein